VSMLQLSAALTTPPFGAANNIHLCYEVNTSVALHRLVKGDQLLPESARS
jgi:hypothetical protein